MGRAAKKGNYKGKTSCRRIKTAARGFAIPGFTGISMFAFLLPLKTFMLFASYAIALSSRSDFSPVS